MIPREGPPFPGFLPLVLRPKLPFYSLEWAGGGREGVGEERRNKKRGGRGREKEEG